MQQLGGMAVNQHLQIGLLQGYAPAGANIDLLLKPVKEINDKMILFIEVLLSTNTDSIGDFMSIDLAPNLDIMLNDTMVINAGLAVNLYTRAMPATKILQYNLAVVAGLLVLSTSIEGLR